MLHVLVLDSSPVQGSPFPTASRMTQRWLRCVPSPPHDTEQASQALQGLHLQSSVSSVNSHRRIAELTRHGKEVLAQNEFYARKEAYLVTRTFRRSCGMISHDISPIYRNTACRFGNSLEWRDARKSPGRYRTWRHCRTRPRSSHPQSMPHRELPS